MRMWVITVYNKGSVKMFEYELEIEAKQSIKEMKGFKILSEIIYFND